MEKNKGIITVILVMFFMLAVIVIALVVVFKGKDLVKMLNIHISLPPPPKSVQLSKPPTSKTTTNSASSKTEKPKPKPTPPPGFTIEQLSPYYDLVRIDSVSPPYSLDPNSKSSFILKSVSSLEAPINITGWRLKTNVGEIDIPEAINDYNPFFYKKSDIILGANHYVYFYSNKSANGLSFRLNKCIGYLNNAYIFEPKVYSSCPKLVNNRRDIIRFSGKCQSFILSLGSCEEPGPNKMNTFGTEPECVNYVRERIGYGNCYKRHHYENDFFLKSWNIWLNRRLPFDREHDYVLLLDKNGLLVDEYIY